ncbi:MAG: hypothetical protein ACPGUV_04495, partial [Polyangiales bacterium]
AELARKRPQHATASRRESGTRRAVSGRTLRPGPRPSAPAPHDLSLRALAAPLPQRPRTARRPTSGPAEVIRPQSSRPPPLTSISARPQRNEVAPAPAGAQRRDQAATTDGPSQAATSRSPEQTPVTHTANRDQTDATATATAASQDRAASPGRARAAAATQPADSHAAAVAGEALATATATSTTGSQAKHRTLRLAPTPTGLKAPPLPMLRRASDPELADPLLRTLQRQRRLSASLALLWLLTLAIAVTSHTRAGAALWQHMQQRVQRWARLGGGMLTALGQPAAPEDGAADIPHAPPPPRAGLPQHLAAWSAPWFRPTLKAHSSDTTAATAPATARPLLPGDAKTRRRYQRLRRHAQRWHAKAEPQRALRLLRRAWARWPMDPAVAATARTWAVQSGRMKEAERWAGRAVQLAPTNAAYWLALGDVRQRRGRRQAARMAWQQALTVDAHFTEAQQRLQRATTTATRQPRQSPTPWTP